MKRGTVLIGEDDAAMRETLALQFESEGFDPVTVDNGQKLIDALQSMIPPVAIVTDVHMERMNGVETLRRLLSSGLALPPVFIITSFPERVTLDLLSNLGCVRVFEKPFDLDELTDAIKGLPPEERPTRLPRARPARVLIVEDHPADAALTREAFGRTRQAIKLDHVTDGAQCLAFLRGEGEFSQRLFPDLVLLDLNMPRMDGRECLERIMGDDSLPSVPVVIMTTSANQDDMRRMRELRCSAYFVKPLDLHRFISLVEGLADFWLGGASPGGAEGEQ